MKGYRPFVSLIKDSASRFSSDKVPMMGAALSYYTAFSIAPLLVIVLGIVGMVMGKDSGRTIYQALAGMVGPNGAEAIRSMVQSRGDPGKTGTIATIVGVVTLIAGASGVFTQLQESLNLIWRVTKKPTAGWMSVIRQRLLSFGMVGTISFLLLVSLVASAALATVGGAGLAWKALNVVVSLAVTAVMFAAVFKFLPDVKLQWRDVLTGGLFTAALFTLGKSAIGAYIGRSGVASAYGAAGSLIVVLLWVFYSSQLVLFGAEFTRAFATREGREVAPRNDATITVTPFTEAAIGEQAAERKPAAVLPPAEAAGLASYAAGAASVVLGGLLLKRSARWHWRAAAAGYAAGGFLLGAAAGLFGLLELAKRMNAGSEEDKEPSAASKLVSKIPAGIKVATVMGAIKGGGGEALHEAGDKMRRMIRYPHEHERKHGPHNGRVKRHRV
jgi:membrane protein